MDTLYVYEGVSSEYFPLRDSWAYSIVDVRNPFPEVIHINNQTRELSYCGGMGNSTGELTIVLKKKDVLTEVTLHLKKAGVCSLLSSQLDAFDLPHGSQACILKNLPDLHVIDPSIFTEDHMDSCSTVPSFSYSLSTNLSPRYAVVSSLFFVPADGIYSFTIMGDATVQLFLHHMGSPLFDITDEGAYAHKATLRLQAGYHRLVAYGFFSAAHSFRLLWSARTGDVLLKSVAYEELRVIPAPARVPRLPRVLEAPAGIEQKFVFASVLANDVTVHVTEGACAMAERATLYVMPGETDCAVGFVVRGTVGEMEGSVTVHPVVMEAGVEAVL